MCAHQIVSSRKQRRCSGFIAVNCIPSQPVAESPLSQSKFPEISGGVERSSYVCPGSVQPVELNRPHGNSRSSVLPADFWEFQHSGKSVRLKIRYANGEKSAANPNPSVVAYMPKSGGRLSPRRELADHPLKTFSHSSKGPGADGAQLQGRNRDAASHQLSNAEWV